MKRTFSSLITALLLAGGAQAASLTVDLSGVEARGGKLYISVQTKDQYQKKEGLGDVVDSPSAGNHSFTYEVPEGRYAVSIWHDDNSNDIFDVGGQYGMPQDGWAMHNGLKLRAAPTFEDVSVLVTESGASVTEKMTYGR